MEIIYTIIIILFIILFLPSIIVFSMEGKKYLKMYYIIYLFFKKNVACNYCITSQVSNNKNILNKEITEHYYFDSNYLIKRVIFYNYHNKKTTINEEYVRISILGENYQQLRLRPILCLHLFLFYYSLKIFKLQKINKVKVNSFRGMKDRYKKIDRQNKLNSILK